MLWIPPLSSTQKPLLPHTFLRNPQGWWPPEHTQHVTSKGPEAQFGAREAKEFHFRYSRNSALSEHAAFFETYILVKKLTVLVISTAFVRNSCFNMFKLAFFKISLVEAMEMKIHEADCQSPALQLRV